MLNEDIWRTLRSLLVYGVKIMEKLFLPALRGLIGDWVYYPTLMKLKDIAERVCIAEEICQSSSLNEMVQRWIKEDRGKNIKDYLLKQEQRFFNSLIVAVHEGDPSWYDITRIESNSQFDAEDIPEDVVAGIGILSLNGEEKLFVLDGQHRLIGIKEAVKESPQLGEDELAIIFIAHRTSPEGMKRSRRLFTTLNKYAVQVSKGETIALDEDDTMAIIVRRLVTENPMFNNDRILNNATNNIPSSNFTCLTTIGNLYDLLEILFAKIYIISKQKKPKDIKDELTKIRLNDDILNKHYANACNYFERLAAGFSPLTEFFDATDYPTIVRRYRHLDGGSILFRPVGLVIIAEIVSMLVRNNSLDECFTLVAKLPTDLTAKPYNGVIWHPTQKKLQIREKTLVRNVLLFMLNSYDGNEDELHNEYAKAIEREKYEVDLPQKV